jgi:hypothetical protein
MTITSTTVRTIYDGDASTIAFPTGFKFFENSHVEVIHVDADGVETVWTEGTEYTLTGAAEDSGGTVTVETTPTDYTPAAVEQLVVRRVVPNTQEIDLPLGGPLPSGSVERMADLAAMRDQGSEERFGRTLHYPRSEDVESELPGIADRANKYLSFDSDGAPTVSDTPTIDTAILSVVAAADPGHVEGRIWIDTGTVGKLIVKISDGTDWTTISEAVIATNVAAAWALGAAIAASSAILPGLVELATSAEVLTGTDTARAITPEGAAANFLYQGIHSLWIPASAMIPTTTNGAGRPGAVELATNDVMIDPLDFDTATQEFAQFDIGMPKSWDLGTFTFIPHWTAASGSGTVQWGLRARCARNDDALDQAWGTEKTSDDTLITANDEHIGPESTAITPAGTAAAGARVIFQIKRNVAADNLGVDARLLGIKLLYGVGAKNDA